MYALPSLHQQNDYTNADKTIRSPRKSRGSFSPAPRGVLGNGFCFKEHLKIKNTVRCDFMHCRAPKFLLRSMPPEPLNNASNSFPPKLKILDRTLSSQNMRGQTAHNRPSFSNPLGEKRRHPIFEDKHPGCMFQLSLQVSGIP